MRSAVSRLAESITKRSLNLNEASRTLLPPIPCVGQCADRILSHALTRPLLDYIGESFVLIGIFL